MGVEDTTRTDARTETSDKPASQERPSAPPPDNPGSPGQPSRLESRARAREEQQSRAQETRDTGTGSPPREDRDDKATTEQTGSKNEKTETSGKPEAKDRDRREDDDRPGTDQPGRHDKREQQPRSQDEGTTDARRPDSGTPGDRDRPQAQTAEQRADTRTEPADRPASSERRWTPPPDNPGSPGQPSRLESLARAREHQQAAAAQRNGAGEGRGESGAERDVEPASTQPEDDGVNTPAADKAEATGSEQRADQPERDEGGSESGEVTGQDETGARTQPRDAVTPAGGTIGTDAPGGPAAAEPEPRERPAEPPRDSEQNPQTADGPSDDGHRPGPESAEQPAAPGNDTGPRAHDGEPGDRHTTDNAQASPEKADQDSGTPEVRGDLDGDRDKKAEEPESSEPADQINPPDRDTGQSGEAEEPGRELAPHEASTTDVEEEPGRFQGRVTIPVDSDRRPIPSSRDTGNDTADRGDLRRPEDDPADRRYNEPDPERRSRRIDLYRGVFDRPNDAKKAVDEYARPAEKGLERIQPTGQICGARSNYDHIQSADQPTKTGNAAIGVISMAIISTEAVRYGVRLARRLRGRSYASN
ncbi:hypothetical protein ACN3XK_39570 [Actinomadura welshii]